MKKLYSILCIGLALVLAACQGGDISSLPEVVSSEPPLITKSAIRPAVPEEAHSFYTHLSFAGIDQPVYAFTDADGVYNYRVYGERDEMEDNVVVATEAGYYEAALEQEQLVVEDEPAVDEAVADPADEPSEEDNQENLATEADDSSEDEEQEEPVVNSVMYTIEISKNTVPLEDGADVPGECEPQEVPGDIDIPEGYEPADQTGVFSYTDIYGEVQYRVFGKLGEIVAFWPADESGQMLPGALAVDVLLDAEMVLGEDDEPIEKPENYTGTETLITFITSDTCFVYYIEVEEEEDEQQANSQAQSRASNGGTSAAGGGGASAGGNTPDAGGVPGTGVEGTNPGSEGGGLNVTTPPDTSEDNAGTSPPPTVEPVTYNAAGSAYCQAVFSGINSERRRIQRDNGQPETDAAWSDDLASGAQAYSLVMAQNDSLDHSGGAFVESLGRTSAGAESAGSTLVIHNGGLVDCIYIGVGATTRSDTSYVYVCARGLRE